MCDFREAELVVRIETYQRIINKYLTFPIIVFMPAHDILGLPLGSLHKYLKGLEPETLIMISVKSANSCDLAIVEQSVVFAPNIEITASELINILDKGE